MRGVTFIELTDGCSISFYWGVREGFGGFGSESAHFLGIGHEVAFTLMELIHGIVVVVMSLFDRFLNFIHVVNKSHKLVIHISAHLCYLDGVACLAIMAP